MYNKTILAVLLSFSFLLAPSKSAHAVNGPSDAVALVSTAVIAVAGAFSAYSWQQASNHEYILNQLASIQGQDSWSAIFMRHCGKIAVATGFVAGVLLAQHCTHTGIPAIDRKLGLPRK